jgi:hypothetical protein
MRSVRCYSGMLLAALVLLLPLALARADEFALVVSGQIIGEAPVKGGTQYVSTVEGDGSPTGPVVGVSAFIIRGASIEEGLVVLADANEDLLFLVGAGNFTTPTNFEGAADIIGGTGRYANATGTLSFVGEDLGGSQFYVLYVGEIDL